ncbi:AB-hydrolase lipase domain-containing protein, partial [Cynara cardunculus var. scolymus]
SVKTVTYESLSNILRLINGLSALLLAILPGKANILEGIHGWELKPTFRGPKLPRWMEDGVSSFNHFIHELDYDSASSVDYSSGDDIDEYDDDCIYPATPLSARCHISRASSFTKRERSRAHWIISILKFLLIPLRLILWIPVYVYKAIFHRGARIHTTNPRRVQTSHAAKKALDHDLHLGIEIFIETIFDGIHHAARCLLSPLDSLRMLLRWSSSSSSGSGKIPRNDPGVSVVTSTLADPDPTVTEKKSTLSTRLNIDARTCRDVITELGYPYEAINVVTSDGYVLLLERIPRRDSKKAVYLQHEKLTSFGRYWRYSINEHGTKDLPALIGKIHQVKTSELKSSAKPDTEEPNPEQPYKLCAICHSLGGAAILMYIITRRVEKIPHRLSRLILLSPAGFHHDSPFFFTVIEYSCLWLAPILAPLFPGLYIPTRFFRMLVNKLARDLHNYPAVGGLVQTLVSYVIGGDCSNWVGVMGLPHYNMNDMPGVAFGVALHLAQMKHARKFVMFDYGSRAANMLVYGAPKPLDLGEHYNLIDIPVDLVAGMKDKVILPSMIRKHYKTMKEAGVDASYKQFEYAHLDFTFSHREELLEYVMSRLLQVAPGSKPKAMKLKRIETSLAK